MAATFKYLIHLIPAWATAYILASVLHTQMVLINLVQLDIAIPFDDWLTTTLHDIAGLLPAYGSAMLLAMLLATLAVTFIVRPASRPSALIWYALAGAAAVLVMLIAMQPLLNVTLIAGARSAMGMLLQCLSGAAGGVVFGVLRLPDSSPSPK